MKKSVKWLLLGLLVLVLAGGAGYSMLAPVPVPLTVVTAGTAELSFTEQGLYAASRVIRVYPLVQGRLLEVPVREGQAVKAGDILCVIDPEPILQGMEQIRSGIRGYEAQARAAEAQERSGNASKEEQIQLQRILIEQSSRNLDNAREELARAELLYEAGAIAKYDLDQYASQATQAATAFEANQQELAVLEAGAGSSGMAEYYKALIELEEINLSRLEKDLEHSRVAAPADGVLTMLEAGNANYVAAGISIAEITVLEGGAIEVYVSTKDVDSIHIGDSVDIIVKRREGNITFTGSVKDVETNAELRISALGLEERRVKVSIAPGTDMPEGVTLGAGYDVDVKFILYREEGKLCVPKTAIYKDAGSEMVWLLQSGRLEAIAVETGMELRTAYVVETGLSPGDTVVTDADNAALKNGLRVSSPS